MKKIVLALMLALSFSAGLFAQRKITIKMASPVPENTPWGQCLNQIAAEWRRITGGEVEILIYHNGVAGNEEAVVRNLRVNQIQAAVLSTFGMYELSPEIMTLSCPFLIRNDEELDLVLARFLEREFDRLDDEGLADFEDLLRCDDYDLWAMVNGSRPCVVDRWQEIIERLRLC